MASYPRVLSLCSGYGGLDIAVKRVFPSARTVCYVEREVSCVRILASRMAEGSLDPAPVWDDVATFDPQPWAGAVDLIVAGFPCQPHSVAGKREGVNDDRWPVWDDVIRIARGCAARAVFLENVPGLLTSSGGASIARVRADLDDAGFAHQRACIIAASDVGASHRRQRLFILAHRNDVGLEWIGVSWGGRDGSPHKGEGVVADIDSKRQSQRGNERETVGDANCEGLERYGKQCELSAPRGQVAPCRSSYGLFAPGPDADWSAVHPRLWPATAQPSIRRMVDGTAGGLDITRAEKLHMLGNGVVPFQAAIALQALMESLEDV